MPFKNNILPVINKPTRITKTSASAIDNIPINNFVRNSFETGILKTDVSDHFPIFIIIKNKQVIKTTENTTITTRDISKNNLNKLNNALYNENWSDVLNSNDTNFSFNSFLTTYLKHFNQNCPNKTKTIKKSIVNQWMTASLIKSSKRKNFKSFFTKLNFS